MKLLKLVALILFFPFALLAQDVKDITVNEGTVKMGKKKMACFYAEMPYSTSETKKGIEDFLNNSELKPSARKKGFVIHRGQVWLFIADTKNDYYYKVKNKKGKTILYLTVSKGYDNYVTLANDGLTASKAAFFLKKVNGHIANMLYLQQKQAEMKAIEAKKEAATQALKEVKKEEAEKSKEIQQLKRSGGSNQTR